MRSRLLTLFFALLLLLNITYIVVGLVSIPRFYQRVVSQRVEPVILANDLQTSNGLIAQAAADRGLSLEGYALYKVILNGLLALLPTLVAILIASKARNQWFAWYSAFLITYLAVDQLWEQTLSALLLPLPVLGVALAFISLFWFLFLPYLYLFPNGIPAPRQTGWIIGLIVAYHFIVQVLTVLDLLRPYFFPNLVIPFSWSNEIATLPIMVGFVLALGCQVYRYWRISTLIERQQTKWFVYGLAIFVITIPISLASIGSMGVILNDLISNILLVILPISLGIAILKYRLWEIDIIIRRTLIYVPLTIILALIFSLAQEVSSHFLTGILGQGSAASTVVTALIVVAVFDPLKTSIGHLVDKFSKQIPDPARTTKEFRKKIQARTLCVGLEEVTKQLLEEVVVGFGIPSGAIYLGEHGYSAPVHATPGWNGVAELTVPLKSSEQAEQLGLIALGPQRIGGVYMHREREMLAEMAQIVAAAVEQDQQLAPLQIPATGGTNLPLTTRESQPRLSAGGIGLSPQ